MKRLARIGAGVVLAVVAVSALLVGGTLTTLRTHWGSDWARRLALSRVNAAITGTLDVGRFRFGGDRVTCDDVALRAPDGAVVVRVSHVELEFSPLALFRRRVDIRRLTIDGPALDLRQDNSGSNLDRALAPRHPSPPSAPATAGTTNGSIVLELDELRVRDGALEVSQTKPGAMARVLGARGVVIDGHGRYETGPRIFAGAVDASATIEAPLRAPLAIHASGTGHGEAIEASLSASLEDTALAVTLHGEDTQHLTVRWPRLHVTPAVVRAALPAARLLVPLDVDGHATRDGALVSFATRVRGAAWMLDARGALDLSTLRARDLSIDAHDIDLGATIAGLPRSRLSLELHAQGGGTSLGDLDGGLELEVPAGTLDGIPVAPSSLRLTAKKGHVTVQALRLTLPGLLATGQGSEAADQLALALSVHATDLHELTRVAAAFAPGVPSIAGRGTLALSLSGTPAAPGVAIDAAFPSVSMAQNHLTGLRLAARVPDARQPLIGEAHLRIASALLAGRPLRTVIANLRSTPPRLAGDVSVAGGAPIAFIVEGAWASDHRALDVAHLSFRYPQGAWSLTRPARLVFEDDHLALSRFDLVSGPQRLAVDLDKRGPRVHGAVHIAGFDLSKLPPLLLPPGQSVAGWVDADVALDGTVGSPDVHANVHLRDGSVGRYHDLSLSLEGHYADRRAVGALDAAGLGTSVRARFDAPTAWPLTNVHQPLALDVVIPETDIAPLLAALGVRPPRPVDGRLSIAMHLGGTAAAPALQLDTKARALVMDGQPVGDVSLRVQGDAHTPLSVSLALGADAGAARTPSAGVASGLLSVHTDLSLASLAVHPPTTGELLRAPVQIAGQLHDVSLAGLSRLGGTSSPWAGTASLRLSASGTALAPAGALALRLSGVSGPGLPATDARLDARIDQRDTRVALRIARDGHPLAWASAIWGLAGSRMRDRSAMARAPLELTAGMGPLLLHRTGIPGSVGPAGSDELKATLRAEASIKGSLARPQVAVTATVRDARLGQQPLGTADATLDYATGRARAEAWLRSASGGALHVTGHAKADLAYPQVTRLDAGAIPFEVNLSGDRFDLGWLSGLNRTVRQVGGQLAAGITAQGTPRAPRIQGQLEWSNGTLMLTSLGSYRSVHLKMHGDQRGVRIDDLRLASGDGDAHLQASAQVQTGGAYTLDATASLRRFPVYGQGQALATLSVDSHVSGTASARRADAKAAISEAHIELNDVKQKKLQPLQRPADVVLMDGVRPADETGARQLAAWNGSPPIELKDGGGDKPVSPSASPPFTARLAIDAPRNLWVHGKDAALELGLGPDFRVESGKRVAVYGQVLVHRGRIDVLGRRFDLQPSSVVQFSGPPDRPRLDVTAKYYNETELITVMLTAKGTLDKLAIAVSSPERPDLTEGQLYTLIVTGRLQLGGNTAGSTSASGQAASLVGGLVAAQLQKTLAHKLPLDVLTLEAGDAGLTGSRLEAGTYLTSKLYAGYVGRVGANPALLQNRNAVHLEYQLSRRWSLDAEYGDIGTGTADLLWTKNY